MYVCMYIFFVPTGFKETYQNICYIENFNKNKLELRKLLELFSNFRS